MDYVDPQLGLTFEQRRDVWHRVRSGIDRKAICRSVRIRSNVLMAVPAIASAPLWITCIQLDLPQVFLPVVIVGMFAFVWVLMAFIGRWSYRPLVIEALRHCGYDVCAECGYDLRGVSETTERCPECGTKRAMILADDRGAHATGDVHEPAR